MARSYGSGWVTAMSAGGTLAPVSRDAPLDEIEFGLLGTLSRRLRRRLAEHLTARTLRSGWACSPSIGSTSFGARAGRPR
jgi:hypothetical protein